MKALSAALVLGLAAFGAAGTALADAQVRIYATVPAQYDAAPQPGTVYYGEPGRYQGDPDWRARREWREDQWRHAEWQRQEDWRRQEEWRRQQWQREQWRREHWRREQWRREQWRHHRGGWDD